MWSDEMNVLFTMVEREERILELLIDRAQWHYRKYRRLLDKNGCSRIEPDEVVVTILDAACLASEILQQASSSCAAVVKRNPSKARHLNQARRFLRFAWKLTEDLLAESRRRFLNHKSQNHPSAKARTAESSLMLAEAISNILRYDPDGYVHPDYRKWRRLSNACRRRFRTLKKRAVC